MPWCCFPRLIRKFHNGRSTTTKWNDNIGTSYFVKNPDIFTVPTFQVGEFYFWESRRRTRTEDIFDVRLIIRLRCHFSIYSLSEVGRKNESVGQIFHPGFIHRSRNFVKCGSRSAIMVLPTLRLEKNLVSRLEVIIGEIFRWWPNDLKKFLRRPLFLHPSGPYCKCTNFREDLFSQIRKSFISWGFIFK